HDLGRFYASAVRSGLGQDRPMVIGLHGQTIFHSPTKRNPATFQLGEAAWLVEELRLPVVSNFRAADLAAGGQGAPLATLFHKLAFGQRKRVVCVNNLGGISNVTLLDFRATDSPRILAFDTGPANMLLDIAVRYFTDGRKKCDADGKWGARGIVDEVLLSEWLEHPFFRAPPPKSTGREMFGETFWQSALRRIKARRLSCIDVIATLTEYTARSIALNYALHLGVKPDRVILCGGGAANHTLVQRITQSLRALFANVEVVASDSLGWPLQAVEPAAFAVLAWHRIKGLPGNLPETTGARHSAVLGQLSVP
ncbi:MAG: anhydro-N-acetylmuramic acid kinase, partial [Verrucomicrobiia bacterium]